MGKPWSGTRNGIPFRHVSQSKGGNEMDEIAAEKWVSGRKEAEACRRKEWCGKKKTDGQRWGAKGPPGEGGDLVKRLRTRDLRRHIEGLRWWKVCRGDAVFGGDLNEVRSPSASRSSHQQREGEKEGRTFQHFDRKGLGPTASS